LNKKPSYRYDSRPYCLAADCLVISDLLNSISSCFRHYCALKSKRIGVTSLTYQGHVTTSVTWPFDTA